MCQSMGRPPISTMGLGRREVSSLILVPKPPARMIAFISLHPWNLIEWIIREETPPRFADSFLCTAVSRRVIDDGFNNGHRCLSDLAVHSTEIFADDAEQHCVDADR